MPTFFGWDIYAVAGGSMEPTYHLGSLIFIKPAKPEEVKIGDCITYRCDDVTITHRVIQINSAHGFFITKGDANSLPDQAVEFNRLMGIAESYSLPYLGSFSIWLKKCGILVMGILLLLSIAFLVNSVIQNNNKAAHVNDD